MPGNARRGQPQGKCHRKQTAGRAPQARPSARVKGCGKSAPRRRQRWRQGKPHREQDRVGAAGPGPARDRQPGAFPRRRPGRSREASGDGRPRGMVIHGPPGPRQNPAYRPSGDFCHHRLQRRANRKRTSFCRNALPALLRALFGGMNSILFCSVSLAISPWQKLENREIPAIYYACPLTPILSHDIPCRTL